MQLGPKKDDICKCYAEGCQKLSQSSNYNFLDEKIGGKLFANVMKKAPI